MSKGSMSMWVLIAALLLFCLVTCSKAFSEESSNPQTDWIEEAKRMEKADPKTDALADFSQGRGRLIGIQGEGFYVPGLKEWKEQKTIKQDPDLNVRTIVTGDFFTSEEEARLHPVLTNYAAQYNQVLLEFIRTMLNDSEIYKESKYVYPEQDIETAIANKDLRFISIRLRGFGESYRTPLKDKIPPQCIEKYGNKIIIAPGTDVFKDPNDEEEIWIRRHTDALIRYAEKYNQLLLSHITEKEKTKAV